MLALNALVDKNFYKKKFNLKRYYLTLNILLGAMASMALAPYNIWILMLIALALFFTMSAFLEKKSTIFLACLALFISYNFLNLDFINYVMQDFGQLNVVVSSLILILFSAYLSLPYAILSALALYLSKTKDNVLLLFFLPAAFLIADIIIYYLFTGFPWNYVGYSAINSPLKAYAPLIGVLGINLCIYLMSAALALAVLRKFYFLPIAAVILVFAVIMQGAQYTSKGKDYAVALVQGNIKQELRWDLDTRSQIIQTYLNLSKDLLTQKNLITIWPESALPVYKETENYLINYLQQTLKEHNSYLITGIQSLNENRLKAYNSILLLDGNSEQLYHKSHLVPFGEFVPFEDLLRPLARIFNFPMSSFDKGTHLQENFKINDLYFINAICYESIFSNIIKDNNHKDSGAILMLSNDGWFGNSRGPYMHLAISQMRSLEIQKPMLRVTNNGISAIIDQQGQIAQSLERNQALSLTTNFTSYTDNTPYAIIGNSFNYIAIIVLIALGLYYRQKQASDLESMAHLIRP